VQTLYWKTIGQTRTLLEKPFASEAEMEKYIFENQELLGDIWVVYRQIKTGQKQGIPDLLGVDQDSRILLPAGLTGDDSGYPGLSIWL
jgi:RecB family endonuclease NucS